MWTVAGHRSSMSTQALLFLLAIVLLVLAAFPLPVRGTRLGLLGAAVALTAYAWPLLTA